VKAVLDTNVLVSAVLSSTGPSARILQAWRRGDFQLVSSAPLLNELDAVLRRPRIRDRLGWTEQELTDFVNALAGSVILVKPERRIDVVADEADNRILEAAVEGEADYVITGDTDLLSIGGHEGIQIVAPGRFAAILSTT
jgi:putative PIN family toxin of toxin-antitoxin system